MALRPLLTACVAKYAGALPAGFRGAEPSCTATTTRNQQSRLANASQPASTSANLSSKAPAVDVGKRPVSFAPDVGGTNEPAATQLPPLSAVVGDESSAKGSPGWLVASLGDVSNLFTKDAKQQFGMINNASSLCKTAVSQLTACSVASKSNGQSHFPVTVASTDHSCVMASSSSHSCSELVRSRGKHSVARLVQPLDKPDLCLFMKAAPAPTSAFGHSGVAYVDTCSDSSLIKAKKCVELGIRMRRLDGSTMHMSTACGVVSQPLVVTEPVHLQFGKGTKHEHRLVCNFVVLNDESLHYDVLLGTPVLRVLGSCICFASSTLTIMPRWWLHNDMTTDFSLPVCHCISSA